MIFDLVHDDFEATTASIPKHKNKTIEEIYQILASIKAKLVSKQAIEMMENLAIVSRKYSF